AAMDIAFGYTLQQINGIIHFGTGDPMTPTPEPSATPTPPGNNPGVISGTVYDSGGITPLPNLEVAFNTFAGDALSYAACTDANGNYTLDGVPVDQDVFVYAFTPNTPDICGASAGNYRGAYWQNTSDFNAASPIHLTAAGGLNATGINFNLAPAGI